MFKSHPYPCIGQFRSPVLALKDHPEDVNVLSGIRADERYLDLACCFGQALRKLVFDAPSENPMGLDFERQLIDLGYDIFLDWSALKSNS